MMTARELMESNPSHILSWNWATLPRHQKSFWRKAYNWLRDYCPHHVVRTHSDLAFFYSPESEKFLKTKEGQDMIQLHYESE